MASAAATADPYPSNMPLTPRESDNEDQGEQSHTTGRKRSASEMEDEAGPSKQSRTSEGERDVPETIEAEVNSDFFIDCPYRPKRVKAGKHRASAVDDVHVNQDAPSLAPHLKITYAVRPGQKWAKLGKFKNAKFKDPFVVVYSAGQIVYVNRHNPIPPSPPADATEDEKLQYDKENLWVGLITEFRAENQEKVYVRVFWLYWPEELPMGRQPYHGKRELVLSNHVDIIEAQTIASHAEISQWDENDDSNKTVLQERYWRQTLDLTKLSGDPNTALSKLRTFCICGGYDNPNVDMYQCHTVGCGMWNHEACLTKAIEERAWEKFKKGALTNEVQEKDESKGLVQKMGETIANVVHRFGADGVHAKAPSETVAISKGNKKLKASSSGKKPWTGKLEGKINKVQRDGEDDTHYATVTQHVATSSSKSSAGFEPKIWQMKMSCLNCGQALN
ncbi:hypothetical protein PV11_01106 [Exophiala sideris]|uniref:BAH domain-containing protein n=1 Tax=Exophiala sideris TaxID=1016849 RepID=A0A0D1YV48_9EURO|nr:hypothetical protein PV11_01106 [Exophiala sideris]